MASEKLTASVVSMLADTGAKNAAARLSMDLDAVTKVFNEELGGIEAKLSILLSHVEGRYESQLANLKLKIKAQKYLLPLLIGALITGVLIGLGLGRTV